LVDGIFSGEEWWVEERFCGEAVGGGEVCWRRGEVVVEERCVGGEGRRH
jgi:hypothetical protein